MSIPFINPMLDGIDNGSLAPPGGAYNTDPSSNTCHNVSPNDRSTTLPGYNYSHEHDTSPHETISLFSGHTNSSLPHAVSQPLIEPRKSHR